MWRGSLSWGRGPIVSPARGEYSPITAEHSNSLANRRTGTTVTPIGPDELPPPYNTLTGGVPMVSCRVCNNMIDISGKKDQVRH